MPEAPTLPVASVGSKQDQLNQALFLGLDRVFLQLQSIIPNIFTEGSGLYHCASAPSTSD